MSDIVIHAEKLSKRYKIGERKYNLTLRETITNAISAPARLFRARQPRSANGDATHIWALKDVSFEIRHGEVVGIIGRNGAGKSTLLKILARVTKPTSGFADVKGRMGSLLEVGTGFHGELTGRENTFLNGAILGMTKAEVARKFDEIVAFAEIDKFIDTPVKHYSSGMYLRLAFAVAAHLETEILLVDEVLAVGDAQFQKKCLGKMGDASRQGRTVLFVSHNMTVLNQLCPRAILFANGRIQQDGRTGDVVAAYLKEGNSSAGEQVWEDPKGAPGNDRIRLRSARIVSRGATASEVNIDEEVSVEVEFWNYRPGARNLYVDFYLLDSAGNTVLSAPSTPRANSLPEEWYDKPHPIGLYRSTCTIPANFLNDSQYYISIYVVSLGPLTIEAEAPQALSFSVFDTGVMRVAGGSRWHGAVRVRLPWRTEYLGDANNDSNCDRVDSAARQ
jgi:lipopolysaccharide transport system ATP-binding protein